jgi:hypothetical protein
MRSLLIIFPDPQLPYSPTTLNLFYELKKHFKVTLISLEPDASYSSQKVNDPDIIYFKNDSSEELQLSLFQRGVTKIKRKLNPLSDEQIKTNNLKNRKAKKIIEVVNKFEGEIIAVDFFALWCVQQAGREAHLVSLEILEYDPYKENCDFYKIKSVIIQSEERYAYLFPDIKPLCFLIQNSPPYVDFTPDYGSRKKNNLIYCGSAMPWFGIISCLDFIKDFPKYNLTIKGAIPKTTLGAINSFYKDLVEDGRLIIDSAYLDAFSLTTFISRFSVGFAFYDFYRFDNVRSFNYYTAPSGKVFQYLNSGVPVIANQLPGFKLIEQNNAGVLIPYLSSNTIKSAIDKIESSYFEVCENAKRASKGMDFIGNAIEFIRYLQNGSS